MQVNADRTAILGQSGGRDSPSRPCFDKKPRQYESDGALHHQFLTMRALKECAPYTASINLARDGSAPAVQDIPVRRPVSAVSAPIPAAA